MPRRKRHEEHENLERWLISYADFITLLFAFFVVMYAVSSVNEGKYRVLSDTLMEAFHTPPKSLQPIQVGNREGVSGPPSTLKSKSDKITQGSKPSAIDRLRASAQNSGLQHLATDFQSAFQPLIDKDLINIKKTDLWVEIEINTSLLFVSGRADVEDEAKPVLNKLAKILRKYPNYIQVEGYTDNLPISTLAYPSNWELSAARAASVVHLFMEDGVQPDRMAAIGYGEYRPIASNATPQGRRKNRRVDVVVLAANNARRALDIDRAPPRQEPPAAPPGNTGTAPAGGAQ